QNLIIFNNNRARSNYYIVEMMIFSHIILDDYKIIFAEICSFWLRLCQAAQKDFCRSYCYAASLFTCFPRLA
ncbi:hypothetical protein KAR91_66950, partial [Candidatus Pacearchaeota archaeon]|nr:hypothetical protein [Candidatus Pacearchaeota archaeon]